MFPDVQTFIAELDRRNELARVNEPVSPDLPRLDPFRFSRQSRERLSAPGLRTFLAIADLWLTRALPKWTAMRIASTWSRSERARFQKQVQDRAS